MMWKLCLCENEVLEHDMHLLPYSHVAIAFPP